jgi:hypothetical protein
MGRITGRVRISLRLTLAFMVYADTTSVTAALVTLTSRSVPLAMPPYRDRPMLPGWVAYFAVGNSSECFGFIKDWV